MFTPLFLHFKTLFIMFSQKRNLQTNEMLNVFSLDGRNNLSINEEILKNARYALLA